MPSLRSVTDCSQCFQTWASLCWFPSAELFYKLDLRNILEYYEYFFIDGRMALCYLRLLLWVSSESPFLSKKNILKQHIFLPKYQINLEKFLLVYDDMTA